MSLEVGWRLSVPLNLNTIGQDSTLLIAATIKPTVAQPHALGAKARTPSICNNLREL